MKREYHKLVRDNIPKIIESNGEKPIIRILSDEEYKDALEKKLYEEYQEVLSSEKSDRLEELADLLEVIKSLAIIEGSTLEEIIEISKKKASKRGELKEKIFLEEVIEK